MRDTITSPSQSTSPWLLEVGLGVSIGVMLALLSPLIRVGSTSLSTTALIVFGVAVGFLLRSLTGRPLVSVAAGIAIWTLLLLNPVYPFRLHSPEGGLYGWGAGDSWMLTGLLFGLAIRDLTTARGAHPATTD